MTLFYPKTCGFARYLGKRSRRAGARGLTHPVVIRSRAQFWHYGKRRTIRLSAAK